MVHPALIKHHRRIIKYYVERYCQLFARRGVSELQFFLFSNKAIDSYEKLWVTNLWNGLHVLTLLPITDIYHARLWVTNQSNGFCVLLERPRNAY